MLSHPELLPRVTHQVWIPCGSMELEGELTLPPRALGLVLFAHGSGSSRHSPRNQFVARFLQEGRLGTLLFDLLTGPEGREDEVTGAYRFDIRLLATRLEAASQWAAEQEPTRGLPQGLFGASTGAAAALIAAARSGSRVGAVVSRGGRPDLAGDALPLVGAPTLLIVGERDPEVIQLNREAMARMACEHELQIVRRATHLFEEPGALRIVADLASTWFRTHLNGGETP